MKYLLIFVLILIVFLFSSYFYFYFKLENQAKIKKPDYIIKENDRLELYSPITIDPKIRRKNIATSR